MKKTGCILLVIVVCIVLFCYSHSNITWSEMFNDAARIPYVGWFIAYNFRPSDFSVPFGSGGTDPSEYVAVNMSLRVKSWCDILRAE